MEWKNLKKRKVRRPLKPTGDLCWTGKTRVAYGPAFLDGEPADHWQQELSNYAKRVEKARRSRRRGHAGTRSLQDTAIEHILKEFHRMTLEAVECLGFILIKRLWSEVKKRGLVCFDTWRIFSELLLHDEASTLDLLRYRQVIKNPKSSLSTYTAPLTNPSFAFITSLFISSPFRTSEMIHLSDLANLCCLEIRNARSPKAFTELDDGSNITFSSVNDRVIRAWSQAATENGAFQVMRILKLHGFDELTDSALAYINHFEALALFEVHGCNFTEAAVSNAADLGWSGLSDNGGNINEEIFKVLKGDCFTSRASEIPQVIEAHTPKPLWDGSHIHWLPPKTFPKNLAGIQAKLSVSTSQLRTKDSVTLDTIPPLTEELRHQLGTDKFTRCDFKLFQATSKTSTWDYDSYSQFHLIGQLRNDQDLTAAGIELGPQSVVSGSILCSIPMAIVRLGPNLTPYTSRLGDSLQPALLASPESLNSAGCYSCKRRVQNLAFVRSGFSEEVDKLLPVVYESSAATLSSQSSSNPQSKRKDQTKGAFRAKKKQKLVDVLDLFR